MGGDGVTIKDVARLANVSVATVSRALNGHENVAEAVRQRVVDIAASLDYSPHHAARSLSSRRNHTVGVVLPDLPCEFFALLMCGIDGAARERGLQLLVSGHHRSSESQAAALRAMRGRVDGILVMSPHAGADVRAAGLPGSLPVLLLDSDVPEPDFRSLRVDNHGGAKVMVQHLVSSGYQRIAFIAGRELHFNASERLRGYRDAMSELLPGVEPWVVSGDFDVASGHLAGCGLLAAEQRPDAVFAANDMMALGCMFAFHQAGVSIPADIGVAGFNDSPMAAHAPTPLTTMRVDIPGLGRQALNMLIEHTGDEGRPSLPLLQPGLVVRASTSRRAVEDALLQASAKKTFASVGFRATGWSV